MDKSRGEYLIFVNEGEQYSLWPAFKGIPEGLRRVGPMGSMEACLPREEDLDQHAAFERVTRRTASLRER